MQHHQAHGLAVLAEHGQRPPAQVIAFDGLGYGTGDAPLWGGEGLQLSADGRCSRLVRLRPFPLPGAGRASSEPRRSALGWLAASGVAALRHPGARATWAAFADDERELVLQALAAGVQSPLTSSVGRLFDAAASLLDLQQQLSYEGQGGLVMEGAAQTRLAASGLAEDAYRLPLVAAPHGGAVPCWWDWQPLLQALLADRAAGVGAGSCALRFHAALVQALAAWAATAAVDWPGPSRPVVVLCGGCFQNRLLLEGAIAALRRAGLEPLWAQQLPCGDGGLALGQLLAASLAASLPA